MWLTMGVGCTFLPSPPQAKQSRRMHSKSSSFGQAMGQFRISFSPRSALPRCCMHKVERKQLVAARAASGGWDATVSAITAHTCEFQASVTGPMPRTWRGLHKGKMRTATQASAAASSQPPMRDLVKEAQDLAELTLEDRGVVQLFRVGKHTASRVVCRAGTAYAVPAVG